MAKSNAYFVLCNNLKDIIMSLTDDSDYEAELDAIEGDSYEDATTIVEMLQSGWGFSSSEMIDVILRGLEE